MAVSVKTSGSQTATAGGTEDVLATVTDPGVYQLVVDLANMALGDVVTLKVYGKARSTDTERLLYSATYTQVQAEPLVESVPVVSPHHMKVSLTQSAGTARTFPWAVYSTGA